MKNLLKGYTQEGDDFLGRYTKMNTRIRALIKKNRLLYGIFNKLKSGYTKFLVLISPKYATKVLYKSTFRKKLDLERPQTLNEKVQWLKLNTYYNNPLVSQCADKYKVRDYVIQCGCGEILNELYLTWNRVDEIDWKSLPDKFAIKCNHGCGYNIVCSNKSNLDENSTKRTLKRWMKEDYWKVYAEVNYKYIEKKIICEKFLEPQDGTMLSDYKVYCFNGKAEYVMLCLGREEGHPRFYYFDRNWQLLPYSKDGLEVKDGKKFIKPDGFELLFEYAEKLASPFPFVRADFYLVDGEVIFGELTFTPSAGLDATRLVSTDKYFGSLVDLSYEGSTRI